MHAAYRSQRRPQKKTKCWWVYWCPTLPVRSIEKCKTSDTEEYHVGTEAVWFGRNRYRINLVEVPKFLYTGSSTSTHSHNSQINFLVVQGDTRVVNHCWWLLLVIHCTSWWKDSVFLAIRTVHSTIILCAKVIFLYIVVRCKLSVCTLFRFTKISKRSIHEFLKFIEYYLCINNNDNNQQNTIATIITNSCIDGKILIWWTDRKFIQLTT